MAPRNCAPLRAVAISPGNAVQLAPSQRRIGDAPRAIGRSGMTFLAGRWSVASMIVGAVCMVATAVWAGGAGFGDDDDNSEEEGPSYFGFVKDANGATMPDAKVMVGVKGRGGVVTRTDALGAYKVPGFGKDVDPQEVEVSCERQGYRQSRIFRRPLPPPDSKIPVETECTMQRG